MIGRYLTCTHRRHCSTFTALVVISLVALDSASLPADAVVAFDAELAAQADEVIEAQMAKQEIVGMAVGLIRDGEIIYLKGFGYADRKQQIAVDRDTLFRWASISKTLTAIAAMQLWEQQQLDLDCDVCTLVPEFPGKGKTITPRQLLCHQGGVVHYSNGEVIRTEREYDSPHPFKNVILALDTFKDSPLIAEPGAKFSYTTHGFILLSAAIERAGEQRFADQVAKRIIKPLGMTTLQPDYQWVDIPHRTLGYRKVEGEIVPSTDTDVSWKLGGGGYLSNIDDLAKYAVGLLKGRLVSKETEQLMWTPQLTKDEKETLYGLGFFVSGEGDDVEISHGGAQEKTRTHLAIRPKQGIGVVVMCNSEYAVPPRFATRLVPLLQESLAVAP